MTILMCSQNGQSSQTAQKCEINYPTALIFSNLLAILFSHQEEVQGTGQTKTPLMARYSY